MEYRIVVAALVLFLLVLYAVRQREKWGIPLEERPGLIRAITAVLAALLAAGAVLWLNHLAHEPDSTAIAYLLTAGICAGSVIYLVGTVRGHGQLAFRLRWVGWLVMTLPLVIPSTFSLALPLVAVLAVTLTPLPPRPESEQPSRDVVVPR